MPLIKRKYFFSYSEKKLTNRKIFFTITSAVSIRILSKSLLFLGYLKGSPILSIFIHKINTIHFFGMFVAFWKTTV